MLPRWWAKTCFIERPPAAPTAPASTWQKRRQKAAGPQRHGGNRQSTRADQYLVEEAAASTRRRRSCAEGSPRQVPRLGRRHQFSARPRGWARSSEASGSVGVGSSPAIDQGAPAGAAAGREVSLTEGGDDGGQARRAGGLDRQAARRLRDRPCRGTHRPAINGTAVARRLGASCENGDVDRVGRHADCGSSRANHLWSSSVSLTTLSRGHLCAHAASASAVAVNVNFTPCAGRALRRGMRTALAELDCAREQGSAHAHRRFSLLIFRGAPDVAAPQTDSHANARPRLFRAPSVASAAPRRSCSTTTC